MPLIKITGRIRNEAMPKTTRMDNQVDVANNINPKDSKPDGYRHVKNRIREVDPYEVMGTNLKNHVVKKRNERK